MKSILVVLLKLLIAFGLVFYLFKAEILNWSELRELLTVGWTIVLLGLLGLNLFLVSKRWQILMQARGIGISYLETLKLVLIGMFFNYALPGGVGGDLVKGYYVVQENPNARLGAAMSVLLDRILGLYSMLLLALISIVINWKVVIGNDTVLSLSAMVLVCFIIGSILMSFAMSSRVRNHHLVDKLLASVPGKEFISKVYDGFQSYRKNYKVIIQSILLSLVAQSVIIVLIYLIATSYGVDIPLIVFFFAVPLGMIVIALPISPAGVGVGQLALATFIGLYAPEGKSAGAAALTAVQAGLLGWGLLGSVFYLKRGKVSLEKIESQTTV